MPRPAPRDAPATSATLPASGPDVVMGPSIRGVGVAAGTLSTSTAARTSAPPASCAGPSDSPNARNASPTVVSGSAVDRIAAVRRADAPEPGEEQADGADRRDDREPASQPKPAALTSPRRRSPPAAPASVSVAAAPVQTSALRTSGPTRSATPAEVRT